MRLVEALPIAAVALLSGTAVRAQTADSLGDGAGATRVRLLVPSLPPGATLMVGRVVSSAHPGDEQRTVTLSTASGIRTIPCSMIRHAEIEQRKQSPLVRHVGMAIGGAAIGALLGNLMVTEGPTEYGPSGAIEKSTTKAIAIGAASGAALALLATRDRTGWAETTLAGCVARR